MKIENHVTASFSTIRLFNLETPSERVEYQRFTKQIQPLQGCDFCLFSPRVARSSRPWAESFNPVGIEKPMEPPQTSLGIPPKTSRNRQKRHSPLQINRSASQICRYGMAVILILILILISFAPSGIRIAKGLQNSFDETAGKCLVYGRSQY